MLGAGGRSPPSRFQLQAGGRGSTSQRAYPGAAAPSIPEVTIVVGGCSANRRAEGQVMVQREPTGPRTFIRSKLFVLTDDRQQELHQELHQGSVTGPLWK